MAAASVPMVGYLETVPGRHAGPLTSWKFPAFFIGVLPSTREGGKNKTEDYVPELFP
jgi:hypothetical protein